MQRRGTAPNPTLAEHYAEKKSDDADTLSPAQPSSSGICAFCSFQHAGASSLGQRSERSGSDVTKLQHAIAQRAMRH